MKEDQQAEGAEQEGAGVVLVQRVAQEPLVAVPPSGQPLELEPVGGGYEELLVGTPMMPKKMVSMPMPKMACSGRYATHGADAWHPPQRG
jgi:hypothetical protein